MNLETLVRRALKDIRQHMAMYALTTMVVTLSILIFLFFSLIYVNLHHFASRFGTQLGVVVYLKEGISEELIPKIYNELLAINGVKNVVYISQEEAFKRLERYLGDEKMVLEGVDATFLPDSFEVKVEKALFQPERLRVIADKIKKIEGVDKVQYGRDWVQRLEVFTGIARNVVVASGILLLFTAAFVVSITIRLNVYARQEELEILRLVGATNGFIEGPFLMEAMLQGLLGAGIAIVLLYASYLNVSSGLLMPGFIKGLKLVFLPWELVALVVGLSMVLCLFGTHFSMRKFLRS